MSEYGSLDEQLKSEGWEVEQFFPSNDDLPERLVETALDLARGKYLEIRLVPGDIARQGKDWLLTEQGHILYVKRTEEERAKDEKLGFKMILAPCYYRGQDPDSTEIKIIN